MDYSLPLVFLDEEMVRFPQLGEGQNFIRESLKGDCGPEAGNQCNAGLFSEQCHQKRKIWKWKVNLKRWIQFSAKCISCSNRERKKTWSQTCFLGIWLSTSSPVLTSGCQRTNKEWRTHQSYKTRAFLSLWKFWPISQNFKRNIFR